jgi:hypothetical protein
MIRMPGSSFQGTPSPLTADEMALREELTAHVRKLGGEIGERNLAHYPRLLQAAQYIQDTLAHSGYEVRRDNY